MGQLLDIAKRTVETVARFSDETCKDAVIQVDRLTDRLDCNLDKAAIMEISAKYAGLSDLAKTLSEFAVELATKLERLDAEVKSNHPDPDHVVNYSIDDDGNVNLIRWCRDQECWRKVPQQKSSSWWADIVAKQATLRGRRVIVHDDGTTSREIVVWMPLPE